MESVPVSNVWIELEIKQMSIMRSSVQSPFLIVVSLGMIIYKTAEEIELIRNSCLLVSKVHETIASVLKPGVTGAVIDKLAEEVIRDHGAVPGFKGYGGFPATLCVSVNEQVVHGIPDAQQVFREGDVVSIDCGAILEGFYGDSAYTFALGSIGEDKKELLEVTKTSLYLGIAQVIEGNRIGDIGYAIQEYTEKKHGFGVVRDLVGHGVGKSLHEDPQVPNFGKRGRGAILKEGLVIAIEPMINLGKKDVITGKDGWTISTRDQSVSAHYEHTVAVSGGKADILSTFSGIEEAILKNDNLLDIGLKDDVMLNLG